MADQVQGVPAPPHSPSSPSTSRTTGPTTAARASHPTCTTRTANSTLKLLSLEARIFRKIWGGCRSSSALHQWLDDCTLFCRGCQGSQILFNTIRRSQIMVSFIRTNKHRLARVTNLFRQQYSKVGNAREQLFHVWRSFSFDENTDTIDAYVTCMRQVAALLGYGKP